MAMYMQICQHDDWQKKICNWDISYQGSTTTRTPFGNFWNTQNEALECRCQEETMWLCTLRIWSVIWAVAARSLWLIGVSFFLSNILGFIMDPLQRDDISGFEHCSYDGLIIHLRSRRAAHNVRMTPRFWGLQNSERSQLLWQQLDLGQHIFAGSTWFIGSWLNHVESRFFMLKEPHFWWLNHNFPWLNELNPHFRCVFSMGFSSLSSFSDGQITIFPMGFHLAILWFRWSSLWNPGRIRGKVQRLDKPRIAPHLSQRSKAGAPRPPKEVQIGAIGWLNHVESFIW